MRESTLQSRLVHYLSLASLLLLMALGGIITLRCGADIGVPRGRLADEQPGVRRNPETGIEFDSLDTTIVSADYELSPTVTIQEGPDEEGQVPDPVHAPCTWKAVRDFGPVIIAREYGGPANPTLDHFVPADPSDVELTSGNIAVIKRDKSRNRNVKFVCQYEYKGRTRLSTHVVRVGNY